MAGYFCPKQSLLAVPLRTSPNVTSTFKSTSMSNGKCNKNLYPYGIEKNIRCSCCFMVGPNGNDCSSPFHPRREIRGGFGLAEKPTKFRGGDPESSHLFVIIQHPHSRNYLNPDIARGLTSSTFLSSSPISVTFSSHSYLLHSLQSIA